VPFDRLRVPFDKLRVPFDRLLDLLGGHLRSRDEYDI